MTFDDLAAQPQDEEGLLHSRDYLLSLVRGEIEGAPGPGPGPGPGPNPSNETSSSPSSPPSSSSPPIPASQVVLGGFSQGGVLSLLAGLPGGAALGLGGVFCLSGYLPLAGAVRAAEARVFPGLGAGAGAGGGGRGGMEVLMVHGDRDPVMNQEWAERSAAIVRELGYGVDLRIVRYVLLTLVHHTLPPSTRSPVLQYTLTKTG